MVKRILILQIVFASIAACSPSINKETAIPSATIAPTKNPTLNQTLTLTPKPYPPMEFWGSPVDLDGLWWMEEGAIGYGVWMEAGIYGIDQENAVLFGNVSVGSGTTFHSILLKTNDGGRSWHQAMEPLAGNSVINLQMFENGNGWALLLWTVEGPGKVSLYHTSDYGSTWQFLTEIPKNIWFAYPTLMEFYNDDEGLIHMYDKGDLPQSTRIVFLSTSDGGYTWQETGSFPLNGETREEFNQQFEAYFNEYEGRTFRSLRSMDRSQFTTNDGIQWKVEEREGKAEVIYVFRRLSQDSEWEIVSILPKQYEYKDGLISAP